MGRKRTPERALLGEVVRVAWPLALGMLSFTLAGVADTWLLGRLGNLELGAAALGGIAFFVNYAFAGGTAGGARVLVAQARGGGRTDLVAAHAWHGVFLTLPIALVAMALATSAAGVFEVLGGSEATRELAARYFRIRILSAPFAFAHMAATGVLQAAGEVRRGMVLLVVWNLLSVLLTALFVYGFGLGFEGAAWAHVASAAVSAALALDQLRRRMGPPPRPRLARLAESLRIGLPLGIRRAFELLGFLGFSSIVASLGEEALAAHQTGLRIASAAFLPGQGVGEAAAIVIGRYTGAGDPERAKQAFRACLGLAWANALVFGALFLAFGSALAAVFVGPASTVEIAGGVLGMAAVLLPFHALSHVSSGALSGTGDVRTPALTGVLSSWLVCVPVAWWFGVELGFAAAGCWVGLVADAGLQGGVFGQRFRRRIGQVAPLVAFERSAETTGSESGESPVYAKAA